MFCQSNSLGSCLDGKSERSQVLTCDVNPLHDVVEMQQLDDELVLVSNVMVQCCATLSNHTKFEWAAAPVKRSRDATTKSAKQCLGRTTEPASIE